VVNACSLQLAVYSQPCVENWLEQEWQSENRLDINMLFTKAQIA